jgi:hypothetical protein
VTTGGFLRARGLATAAFFKGAGLAGKRVSPDFRALWICPARTPRENRSSPAIAFSDLPCDHSSASRSIIARLPALAPQLAKIVAAESGSPRLVSSRLLGGDLLLALKRPSNRLGDALTAKLSRHLRT